MNNSAHKVDSWFDILLDSINYKKPEDVKFPKPFRVSKIAHLYKAELVGIDTIILMLYKAGYLVINKNIINTLNESALLGDMGNIESEVYNIMFVLDLDKTKEYLSLKNFTYTVFIRFS